MRDCLPSRGSVVGIDVGYSPKNLTSSVCILEWDVKAISWRFERFRYLPEDRQKAIDSAIGNRKALAVGIDGPLKLNLEAATTYRMCERMLTSGIHHKIGKPGQSSSPNGKNLSKAAVETAEYLVLTSKVGIASHPQKIHDLAIVEAFPTSFLGLLIEGPVPSRSKRIKRSDQYFSLLANSGRLSSLLETLLPKRIFDDFASIRNHDDRASLVCALTALLVASGTYSAVGCNSDGWIILPPKKWLAPCMLRGLIEAGQRNGEKFLIFEVGAAKDF